MFSKPKLVLHDDYECLYKTYPIKLYIANRGHMKTFIGKNRNHDFIIFFYGNPLFEKQFSHSFKRIVIVDVQWSRSYINCKNCKGFKFSDSMNAN